VPWETYLKLFAALLSICDPIGVVPIFLSLTHDRPPGEAGRIAAAASGAMLLVLLLAMVAGDQLLGVFGIGIPSFRVAGGILLLLLSLSMLRAEATPMRETREEHRESVAKESISVVPLAIPLLAGPGAISTVIVTAHAADTLGHYLRMSLAILGVTVVSFLCLATAPRLARLLGQTGVNIVTRVMGLILAAISIELIAGGLREIFPGLVG